MAEFPGRADTVDECSSVLRPRAAERSAEESGRAKAKEQDKQAITNKAALGSCRSKNLTHLLWAVERGGVAYSKHQSVWLP